ncbi:MAG: SDR family NAD(P)-dependent oxidoreductase [Azospirillaceae bacterium]|nr:SDR family NAD(P)-dependent oxidoreductase [Azospirillaceae bacterium]
MPFRRTLSLRNSGAGYKTTFPNFSLYHATKWGIEGFVDTVAQEVAPFNITFTLVEPGATKTDFGRSLVSPPITELYDRTPAGDVRRAIASGAFAISGDAAKMSDAILRAAEQTPAPRRLALGSDAYQFMHADLSRRLADLEAQRDIAFSGDA